MALGLILYALIVLALLTAELREDTRAQRLFKPLAALGFILIAIKAGALDSLYGQIILAGLIACALGDVLLLSRKSQKLFIAGMAAFALGHLIYMTGFRLQQTEAISAKLMFISIIAIFGGFGFFHWLRPHLPKKMRIPVMLYSVIIILMVIRSFGVPWEGALRLAPIGAVMFAISDMFVARDRFAARSAKNALAITPLYFGAQALFALSVAI